MINPHEGKWWRFKYRYNHKEKLLSLGTYPDISLKEARERRDLERKKLADKIDPALNRRAVKAAWVNNQANSFEVVAREWMDKQSSVWSQSNFDRIKRHLELNIFPWLGERHIADILAPELLADLRRMESRGAIGTAHRVLQTCGQIFRYGIATGRAMRNPAADLRGALKALPKEKHLAAVTDPKAIGELLRSLHAYHGSAIICCALRLAPLTFVRPGELRNAEWREINFDKAEWNIPAERMKMREPHLVPLSRQAVGILEELQPLTGRGKYLFPSPRSGQRPMSDNAVLRALRRIDPSVKMLRLVA